MNKYVCWFEDNPDEKHEIILNGGMREIAESFFYSWDERDTGKIEDQDRTCIIQTEDGAQWKYKMRGSWELQYHVVLCLAPILTNDEAFD